MSDVISGAIIGYLIGSVMVFIESKIRCGKHFMSWIEKK
jgi:hypothetical protein